MKLSTLLSLPSSGGPSSSARNAADGTSGDAFGSLLNGMAKDGSARTLTDGPSEQQIAETTGSSGALVAGAITPALTASGQQGAKTTGLSGALVAGAITPALTASGQQGAKTTGSSGALVAGAITPALTASGQQGAKTTGLSGALVAGAITPALTASGQQAAKTTGSTPVSAPPAIVPTILSLGQLAAGTTGSAGVIVAGALAPTVIPSGQPAVDATVSVGVAVAGAVVSTDFSIGEQAADTKSIASISVTGVSGGKPQAVGSQLTLSAEGEQPRSDAAVTAIAPVQGNRSVANGTDVASLLTLAARAADSTQKVAGPSAPVDAASVATIGASGGTAASLSRPVDTSSVGTSDGTSADAGVHANGRVAKKRSASESSDGVDWEAQAATAAVPQTAAGLVAAVGMLAKAAVPNASAVTTTPANVVAGAPAEALAPGKNVATGAAFAADATQPPLAVLPQVVAMDDLRASLQPPGKASSVDAAIVPGTVQVESHLGFFRSAPVSGAEPPRRSGSVETEPAVESGALATSVNGPGAPAALSRTSLAATAAASPTTRAGAAGVGEADTGPASAQDASLPSRPASISPTSKPASEEPGQVAPDITGAAPAAPVMSIVLPSPQTTAPVAIQVADGVAALAAAAVPDENQLGTQVAPARSMALQLSPAGLGTLTVHLHVVGRALDVRLEASEGSTAALIDRDRDALSGALRGKDYQLQSLTVTIQDATMPGGTNAERGTDAGSANSGSSGPSRDGGTFGGRSGDQASRDTPDKPARPSRGPTEELAAERGGSSLFV